MKSYQELDVWRLGMTLAETCYRITRGFPTTEMYGLTSQMRRASVSIAANIAEGYGRESTPAFIQFLRVSQGSARELETHVLIAQRVEFLNGEDAAKLLGDCERISKMLRNLIRALQVKSKSPAGA